MKHARRGAGPEHTEHPELPEIGFERVADASEQRLDDGLLRVGPGAVPQRGRKARERQRLGGAQADARPTEASAITA